MYILTVNAGSSSLRLALFRSDRNTLVSVAKHRCEIDGNSYAGCLEDFLRRQPRQEIAAVAHRVVHGGASLIRPTLIDAAVEKQIVDLVPLAPLHNPPALECLRAAREALLGIPQVAVFDTGFYAALPEVAATYALPRAMCQRHGIRRYGFHGLAHQAMWRRWRKLRPDRADGGKIISLQLGAGCSATAVDRGRAVDTSMGLSPLEGLVMATRCGDVDPAILTLLQRREGLDPDALEHLLYEDSGLRGITGLSGDVRELINTDDPAARLALDVFVHRVRKYLGAYLAVLGGGDAVLFGGGIGEHQPVLRQRILAGMEWAGIRLAPEANRAAQGREARISAADSPVEAWVVPVDEETVLADEVLRLISTE